MNDHLRGKLGVASGALKGYDIIGDVHGCATQLEELLTELGYRPVDGTGEYRHPRRRAIFVGDLIDTGDQQLQVLEVVKTMVDAGSALAVMGNHEFNALAYHTEWPPGSGQYLRAHGDPNDARFGKNTRQHWAFLEQVTGADRQRYLEWFATLPLWLDLGGLRVVHACWHAESIAVVQRRCGTVTPFDKLDHLVAANSDADPLYAAVETLLKGPEISLSDHGQPAYLDGKGAPRSHARVQWWNSNARTLREIAVIAGHYTTHNGDPYPELPHLEVPAESQSFVYTDEVPVFYGHYWRQHPPRRQHDWTDHTACVDFSAVAGGALTAYRWSGENRITPEHFVAAGGC